MSKRPLVAAMAALALSLLSIGHAAAADPASVAAQSASTLDEKLLWLFVAASLAWLVPIGFTLIAAGGLPAHLARQSALAGLAAMSLAIIGYWAVGFALQFGGIGLVHNVAGLEGLVWEWSALGPEWGPGWGMVGLRGWALLNEADTPLAHLLFLTQLPWAATAALIPLLSLRGRAPALASAVSGLFVGAFLYPLVGNWIQGGGWLANLGLNLGLGHGMVDFGGAASVHLVGAATALAGILLFRPRLSHDLTDSLTTSEVDLPPTELPLLAALGAILIVIGNLGWGFANPLWTWGPDTAIRGLLSSLLAIAGAALTPTAYTWFVAGRQDALMAARGAAAGAIAILASGPFVPPWAGLLIGVVAGALALFATYMVDHVIRLDDPTAVVATHGLGAVWGLLALALFADGLAGQGWNGIGLDRYLGVAGQGVSGLLTAARMQPDWPGQLQAQIVGIAAATLVPFLAATILFAVLAALDRAWQATHGAPTAEESPADFEIPVEAEMAESLEAGR